MDGLNAIHLSFSFLKRPIIHGARIRHAIRGSDQVGYVHRLGRSISIERENI